MAEIQWQPGLYDVDGLDWEVATGKQTGVHYAVLFHKTGKVCHTESKSMVMLTFKMQWLTWTKARPLKKYGIGYA